MCGYSVAPCLYELSYIRYIHSSCICFIVEKEILLTCRACVGQTVPGYEGRAVPVDLADLSGGAGLALAGLSDVVARRTVGLVTGLQERLQGHAGCIGVLEREAAADGGSRRVSRHA